MLFLPQILAFALITLSSVSAISRRTRYSRSSASNSKGFKTTIQSSLALAKERASSGSATFDSIQDVKPITTTFTYPTFANPKAQQYAVKTSALPLFNNLPVQDSYAGRIRAAGTRDSLFFWYFPSSKSGGSKKLSIWLNGGPGCSSLEGATQENGPFTFVSGTSHPVVNNAAWTTQSDMLYIEQPAGVGFSTGSTSDLTGEIPLADDFYKFLVSFFNIFSELKSKDFYITGESYAGFYIPYIAERILHASAAEKAATTLNLKALFIIDGVYSSNIGEQAPVARFSSQNADILGFDKSFLRYLNSTSKACGYEDLLNAVKYPMTNGHIPLPDITDNRCDLFDLYNQEATRLNPWLAALHVSGSATWAECGNDPFVRGIDNTPYSETVLGDILSHIPVLLVHGDLDSVLFTQGDYVTIQNLTWNGSQGFTKPVTSPLLVNGKKGGIWHSERSLTFVEIYDSGHMVPEYQPCLSLALFTSLITTGSIGNGQLSAACTFTETFPVPWPRK